MNKKLNRVSSYHFTCDSAIHEYNNHEFQALLVFDVVYLYSTGEK